MTRALYALLVTPAIFSAGVTPAGEDGPRPNIVFILVDDTGWNALDIPANPAIAGSGSSYYQTALDISRLRSTRMESARSEWH
jgi:hypothetical protein